MSNNNLHKMPANFNSKKRGFPFEVSVRKEKDIYKISIDKYSMVYSFFDEKEVKIDGIDKEYTAKDEDKLVLSLKFTNRSLIISSASLSVKDKLYGVGVESETENCFPGDGYYTQNGVSTPLCLKTLDITIAVFYENTIDGEKVLTVSQYVRRHITRYNAGGTNGFNQL
jgi:hypothetical protein